MKLEIGNIWIDPPDTKISSLPIAFTNIDADVRIHIGHRKFFDADLCIVEFAHVVHCWLAAGDPRPVHFRFESADEDEPNILSFEMLGNGIRIHSAWQKFEAKEPLAADEVDRELKQFVQNVIRRCREDLGVDVKDWIETTS